MERLPPTTRSALCLFERVDGWSTVQHLNNHRRDSTQRRAKPEDDRGTASVAYKQTLTVCLDRPRDRKQTKSLILAQDERWRRA
jgi:hypothetical protein